MSNDKFPSRVGYVAQGVLMSGLLAAGALWAGSCTQIDAFKKVADYKKQYEQYKNQTEQLADLANTDALDQFADLMGSKMDQKLGQIKSRSEGFFNQAYSSNDASEGGGVAGGAAIRKTGGGLGRGNASSAGSGNAGASGSGGSGSSLHQCWESTYTARSTDNTCSSGDKKAMADMSMQPGSNGEVVEPNPELEGEVSRAVLANETPVLDVLRADLAWLRDNPELWAPLRVPADKEALSLPEAAQLTRDQMRMAGILAAHGLPMVDYDTGYGGSQAETIKDIEKTQRAAQATATVSYIASAFGAYPTAMASIIPLKEAIKDVEAADIEDANSGDRKAMRLKFEQLESQVDMLSLESRQRYERLMGVWLAGRTHEKYEKTLNMQN